jgi:hypothetical protein
MGFIGSFLGNDQKKILEQQNEVARQALAKGRSQATAATEGAKTEALGILNPYQQAGSGALDTYQNALGLGGEQAQADYYQNAQFGPAFQAYQDRGVGAIDASRAARGGLYSGGAMKELHDFGMKNFGMFDQDRLNRLQDLSGRGQQVAGQASNVVTGAGGQMADIASGFSQLDANQAINYGNAQSAASGIGMNNILGLGKMAADIGMAAYGMPSMGGDPTTMASGTPDPWEAIVEHNPNYG